MNILKTCIVKVENITQNYTPTVESVSFDDFTVADPAKISVKIRYEDTSLEMRKYILSDFFISVPEIDNLVAPRIDTTITYSFMYDYLYDQSVLADNIIIEDGAVVNINGSMYAKGIERISGTFLNDPRYQNTGIVIKGKLNCQSNKLNIATKGLIQLVSDDSEYKEASQNSIFASDIVIQKNIKNAKMYFSNATLYVKNNMENNGYWEESEIGTSLDNNCIITMENPKYYGLSKDSKLLPKYDFNSSLRRANGNSYGDKYYINIKSQMPEIKNNSNAAVFTDRENISNWYTTGLVKTKVDFENMGSPTTDPLEIYINATRISEIVSKEHEISNIITYSDKTTGEAVYRFITSSSNLFNQSASDPSGTVLPENNIFKHIIISNEDIVIDNTNEFYGLIVTTGNVTIKKLKTFNGAIFAKGNVVFEKETKFNTSRSYLEDAFKGCSDDCKNKVLNMLFPSASTVVTGSKAAIDGFDVKFDKIKKSVKLDNWKVLNN